MNDELMTIDAYGDWRTGHYPDMTLREALERYGGPSETWEVALTENDVHPRVLDLTWNEACDAPDDRLTWDWSEGGPDE